MLLPIAVVFCFKVNGLYPGIAPGWGYYFIPTNKPIYTYYYS